MKIGNVVTRVVKLGAKSAGKFGKGALKNIRQGVKAAAKNSSAALKKAAKVAAKNKKLTAGLIIGAGVLTVGVAEKLKLEAQKIKINGFVESTVDEKDTTTIILNEKGQFPVGSTIYFESDDNFASIPDIIKNFLKQGQYAKLGLDDEEIKIFTNTILEILKDKRDKVVSIDDNDDVITTIDSYNPTIMVNGIEEQNDVQLYDLLTECAKKSSIYLRIIVDIGTSLLNKGGVSKELDKRKLENVATIIAFVVSVLLFFIILQILFIFPILWRIFIGLIIAFFSGRIIKSETAEFLKKTFPHFFYTLRKT
jgi:hypothetical protein